MADDHNENWITIKDAVIATGKADRTLRRWIANGKIPSKRVNNRVFVDLSGLDLDTDQDTGIGDKDTGISDDKVTIARLQAELDGAVREINILRDDRDFLRQALANAMNKIPQLESTVTQDKPKWYQFWR